MANQLKPEAVIKVAVATIIDQEPIATRTIGHHLGVAGITAHCRDGATHNRHGTAELAGNEEE